MDIVYKLCNNRRIPFYHDIKLLKSIKKMYSMDIAWVIDHDHNHIYVNKKFIRLFEKEFTEYVPEVSFIETNNMPSEILFKKVLIRTENPDYDLIDTDHWRASHPNGLLMWKGSPGTRLKGYGSIAINHEGYVYTAFHVGMIWTTSKHDYFNVPMLLKYRTRLVKQTFSPEPETPSAIWQGLGIFRVEEDIAPIGDLDYSEFPFRIPGELVGIISGSMVVDGIKHTICTYFNNMELTKGMKIETIGATTGKRKGKIYSLNATVRYSFFGGAITEYSLPIQANKTFGLELTPLGTPFIDLYLDVTHNFLVTNETTHGDSGGGCYLI